VEAFCIEAKIVGWAYKEWRCTGRTSPDGSAHGGSMQMATYADSRDDPFWKILVR